MKVVSNTSPLINLSRIGQLDLLYRLHNELIIPQAVWNEIVVQGAGQVGAHEVQSAPWIKTQNVANIPLVRTLQRELDAGEAEAIALALELHADVLIMDERLGRRTAQYLGLRCTGLIGILIAAKRQGHIPAIRPQLEALRGSGQFRISESLYDQVLRDEGETI